MFAERNPKKPSKWTVEPTTKEYVKLRDYLDNLISTGEVDSYENAEIIVYGYFINKTDLGEALTIITKDCYINMPSHAIDWFRECTEQEDESIAEGHLKLYNFKDTVIKRFKQKTIYFDFGDC